MHTVWSLDLFNKQNLNHRATELNIQLCTLCSTRNCTATTCQESGPAVENNQIQSRKKLRASCQWRAPASSPSVTRSRDKAKYRRCRSSYVQTPSLCLELTVPVGHGDLGVGPWAHGQELLTQCLFLLRLPTEPEQAGQKGLTALLQSVPSTPQSRGT